MFCAWVQAMRELYAIQSHSEVGLAATAALVTAHQSARTVDQDAVIQLAAYLEVSSSSQHHHVADLFLGQLPACICCSGNTAAARPFVGPTPSSSCSALS